jgi:hypothetical protein
VGPSGVEHRTSPIVPDRVDLAVFWDFESGDAKAEGSITGPAAGGLNWEEPVKLLDDWMDAWRDSAKVRDVRILASGPEAVSFSVGLDAVLPEADKRGRIVVDLPRPPCDLESLFPTDFNKAHSRTDGVLFFPAPVLVHLSWKVRLPDDVVLLPAEDRETASDGGAIAVRWTKKGRLVEVDYRLEWDGRAIEPGAYPRFRMMALDALDPSFTRAVLAEKETETD